MVLGSEAAHAMCLTTENQKTGKANIHAIYFALRSILIEHLELLEHRTTSTASKTMLVCVVYSRKNISSFLVVSAYLADFSSETPNL